ncbi:MAG: hypothetical protein AAF266_16040 [Planctomycetota bacterium]
MPTQESDDTQTPRRPLIDVRRALWLIVPPTLVCLFDIGLTMAGQSEAYWAGDYSAVEELSPSAAHYLSIHPLYAAGMAAVWIGLFTVVIALLPEFLALTVSIAIVIGHLTAATTWLLYRFGSYQGANAVCLLTALVIVLSFKRGQSVDGSSAIDWRRTGLPEPVRWLTIGLLILLPLWWFLIPR